MEREADLLVLDIDGTLLGDDGTVGEADARSIGRFRGDGGNVYLASGRKYRSARQLADVLLPRGVGVIASNGSVYELQSGLAVERIAAGPLELAYRRMGEIGASLFLFGLERTYYTRDLPSYFLEEDRARLVAGRESSLIQISGPSDLRAYAHDIVNGIVIEEGNPALLEEARSALSGIAGITISSSASNNIELYAPHTGKSSAIRRVCADLGIGIDRVMAFGDGFNDIDMLECVGKGVAMGNAPAEVRRCARYVTKRNSECGIAWFLENGRTGESK